MATEKKVPMRMCIACRQMKPKKELLRIVKTEDGVIIDESGKKNGRGAYICDSSDCALKLKKQKILNKVFSCEVDATVYDAIGEKLSGKKQ
ncbi:MAG: YlxR family protein [Clostridia bacterium]|nr:YlxR family protein [Clostridia bacterium]